MKRFPIMTTLFCWRWDSIKQVGNNPSLRSSFLFLAIVPPVAKLLQNVPENVTVHFLSAPFNLHIGLPFSWVALFFCALLVSIGNALYSFCCPELIKNFGDYPTFENSGRGVSLLRSALAVFLSKPSEVGKLDEIVDIVKNKTQPNLEHTILQNIKYQLRQPTGCGSDSFYFVRDALNLRHPVWRCVASTSYILGFALLGYILVQNIKFVLSYIGVL